MRLRFWRLAVLIVLTFVGCIFVASKTLVKAEVPVSPWLVAGLPSLEKVSDLSAAELDSAVQSINRDCQAREIVFRPERKLPYPQSKQSSPGCATDTAYGAVTQGEYLQRQGSTVYGKMQTSGGQSASIVPIPYSNTALAVSGGNYSGSHFWFIKNLDTSISSTAIFNGEVTHKLPPFSSGLKDGAGNLLTTQADTIGFSSNGTWMVADLPGKGAARVNTETYEVLPFGEAVNYNVGVGVGMRTAISPDGRYAVVASKSFYIFRLYDLSTCGPVPQVITTKVTCKFRDLLPFINSSVPNFTSIMRMRFRSNYTLEMNINTTQNNNLITSNYVMVASGQTATNFEYLALGDSFASGEGAYQYKSITDTTDNKCHLSQRSYPYLMAKALGYGKYESVTCSGAKIEDLTNNTEFYLENSSQAKGKSDPRFYEEIINSFLPGFRAQRLFLERYQPSAITLSAGGNDVGFNDKIKRCLDSDTCYSSYEDRVEIINEIDEQFYRLTGLYSQLKANADPRLRLYVIGYPQIAQYNGNCAANVHLNNDEILFSQQLVSYLNSVIKTAAENSGAFYVDIEQAFDGYKMCETDSWNVAINGLTAGNDIANIPFIQGPIGNESYHPNALGHELLKTKIMQQTTNLSAAMPKANPKATLKPAPASLPFLQVPKSNRAIRKIRNVTGTDGGVIRFGQNWVQKYSTLAPYIKGGSKVKAWLQSEPFYLGEFTVDTAGNLTITARLPDSIKPGFHTLHMYGKNTSDEDVDLYQTIYVAPKELVSSCPVALSGTDTDKDNIDDACDGMIDRTPTIVIPEPAITPVVPDGLPTQPVVVTIPTDSEELPALPDVVLVVSTPSSTQSSGQTNARLIVASLQKSPTELQSENYAFVPADSYIAVESPQVASATINTPVQAGVMEKPIVTSPANPGTQHKSRKWKSGAMLLAAPLTSVLLLRLYFKQKTD